MAWQATRDSSTLIIEEGRKVMTSIKGSLGPTFGLVLVAAIATAFPYGAATAEQAIRIGVTQSPNTLDPAKMKTGQEYNFAYMTYSGLTEFGRDLVLRPDLAESWESSPDLKDWTIHLRKGAKFHNGREVDAQDVIATVKRLLDPAVGSVLRVNFDVIESMEATDSHTVHFKLNISYAPFPTLFAGYQAKILPKDNFDKLTTAPIGSGPFKFVEFLPGDRLVLAKNPDYYRNGEPKLDKVIFRTIPEYSANTVALKSGDLDLVWDLPPEEIDAIKGASSVVVDEVATGTWWDLTLNNAIAPFNDIRVRQAFAKLVDKTEFTDIATFGHGSATHSPIPPTHPFFAKDLPFPKPDYDGAKKLLAQAGVDPASIKLKIWTPADYPQLERLCVALRDSAKTIGITIEVQTAPGDKFFGEIEGKEPLATDIFFNRVVPDLMTYPWFHSNGSWNKNLWHFSDSQVDAVLDKARSTSDEAEQKGLYIQLQQLIEEKVPGIIVYNSNHANGISKKVQNFHSSPMLLLDLREVTMAN
jgi:peptide/nickel transport system substrate-binding protein